MTVVLLICAALLTVAGVLALIRAERGPSMLDRTVALDIIVTVVVAAVALYAAAERRTDVVPILVVLSLVGFVGSVTISRFASVEPQGEGRVRSREEIAQEEAERIRAEEEAEAARRARRARESEVATPDAEPVAPVEERRAEEAEGHAADAEASAAQNPDDVEAADEPATTDDADAADAPATEHGQRTDEGSTR